jgi:hypothetical protein
MSALKRLLIITKNIFRRCLNSHPYLVNILSMFEFFEVTPISSVAIHISPRWGEFQPSYSHFTPLGLVSTQKGLNMNSHR